MSEWRPGDVVADRLGHVYFCIEVSENTRTAWKSGACLVSPDGNGIKEEWLQGLHRVAVVDPEDAEHTERMWRLFACVNTRSDLTTALREFARPTPRIEEPVLVGAIIQADVEYENGNGWGPGLWALAEDGTWSCLTDGHTSQNLTWEFFSSIRILSPGVEATS